MSDAGNPNDPSSTWGTPPPGGQPDYGQQAGYGQQGYGQQAGYGPPQPAWGAQPPPGYGYAAQQQTDGKAIGGLITAIASYFVCPGVAAVIALVLASSSNRAIRESGGRLGGEGMNTATKIIAWINIALTVIGVVLFALFAAAIGTATTDTEFLSRTVLGLG